MCVCEVELVLSTGEGLSDRDNDPGGDDDGLALLKERGGVGWLCFIEVVG